MKIEPGSNFHKCQVILSQNILISIRSFVIMSSARTARLIEDAYRADSINDARDAMYEYYNKNCLRPIKQKIHDSHTAQDRTILVPCGRCIHCMESKINEWCTRMYAHAEDFKNVYFVTLTYRSITNPKLEVNKLLLNKLSQAVWNLDAYNSTRHYSYNPCLLVKDHYQKFLKRLRKNTGLTDLSYVLSGEYGEKFGRPHFHMVLFTNGTLTKRDIVRAWSVCLWQTNKGSWTYRTSQKRDGKAYDFPIGSVDFHDLVSNGTFNTTAKIKVDGTFMNAANCFAYVAKYVVKRDKPNLNRVRLAYRNLFTKEECVDLFGNEISFKIAKKWLLEHGYNNVAAENLIQTDLKRLSYEKIFFKPSQTIYEHGILRTKHVQTKNYVFDCILLPENYFDFCEQYCPFCEFSRGVPIGSIYAKRNIQEFADGVFTKPLLQDSGFVVPSYFRIKAKEYLFGFREVRRTLQGTSFALGCLPDLSRRIDLYHQNGTLPFPHMDIKDDCPFFNSDIFVAPTLFVDKYTGERITFDDNSARFYKFSRKKRDYLMTKSVPVPDFIRTLTLQLQGELERAKIQRNASKDNMRLRERALLMLHALGEDEETITKRFKSKQDAYLAELRRQRFELHKSAE